MNSTTKKTTPYHQMLVSLKTLSNLEDSSLLPKVIAVYGSNEFFRKKSIQFIKDLLQKKFGFELDYFELKSHKLNDLIDKLSQESIFGHSAIHVEYHEKVLSHLKSNFKNRKIHQSLILESTQNQLTKASLEFCEKQTLIPILCSPPTISEMNKYVIDLSRKFDLFLDSNAANLLLDSCGENDFVSLENEIRRLSFIFMNKSSTSHLLSNKDISSELSTTREEHIFEIDRLLLERDYVKLSLYVREWIAKGESGLGILALITRHIRNALQLIQSMKGNRSIPPPRLPGFILQNYQRYIQKISEQKLLLALKECHQADIALKSYLSRKEVLVLEKLIHKFCN